MSDQTLTSVEEGCTHHGSSRPRHCGCGQLAAFWTLPSGVCDICHKDVHHYDPDGPPTSTGWCVGCRDRLIIPDDQATP